MTRIGEFARRIGVTPRAVRHDESLGLLRPARIDERTGYRHYGAAELVRAVRIVATIPVDARGLTPCIRRGVQRLRRRVRTLDAAAPWTFAARLPLTVAGPSTVDVGASHPRLGGRHAVWSSQRAVVVEVTGPHELLPAAYDAALADTRDRRLHPTGVVQETYVRLGPVPHTSIAVFVGDGGRDPAAPPAAVSPDRR